jgi:hypothetical protein
VHDLLADLRRRRSLGWRASPPHARDHGFDRLGVSAAKIPERADLLSAYWPEVYDQGWTSSCTGQAASCALALVQRYVEQDPMIAAPSRQALYYNGRALTAHRRGDKSVADDGAYLRDLFDAARRVGVPLERDAAFRPLRINAPPSMGAYVMGHGYRGGSYVRIFETGEQKSLAVRAALAAGFPVVIGSPITVEYTRDGDGHVFDAPRNTEALAGGHAQVIIGYEPSADHGALYRVVNSWGAGWRDNGCAWLTEAFVRWAQMECWIVYGFEVRQ